MIYLITGNMGTGKTSRAVNMILTNEDGLFKQTIEDGSVIDRPLYFAILTAWMPPSLMPTKSRKKKSKAHRWTKSCPPGRC